LEQLKEKIKTLVEEFFNEAKRKKIIPLDLNVIVRFSLKGRRAGWARTYPVPELNFNIPLLSTVSEDDLYQTVGHECCHVFADLANRRRCGHSVLWKATMIVFGLKPERCHNYDLTGIVRGKAYACKCEEKHILSPIVHKRITQGRQYTCRKCKAKLVIEE
jgi:predicted SprT family Zn-dependent metalloprotease